MFRINQSRCTRRLKEFDMFGQEIKLYYKGQSLYTTVCGAITTVVVLAFYLVIASIKLDEFFRMTDPE